MNSSLLISAVADIVIKWTATEKDTLSCLMSAVTESCSGVAWIEVESLYTDGFQVCSRSQFKILLQRRGGQLCNV